MSITMGKMFKMTKKTKLYLFLYKVFDKIGKIGQYFINHCDFENQEISESLRSLYPEIELSGEIDSLARFVASMPKKVTPEEERSRI